MKKKRDTVESSRQNTIRFRGKRKFKCVGDVENDIGIGDFGLLGWARTTALKNVARPQKQTNHLILAGINKKKENKKQSFLRNWRK